MGSQFCRQSPLSPPLPIFFSPSYFAKRGAAPPPSNEITPLPSRLRRHLFSADVSPFPYGPRAPRLGESWKLCDTAAVSATCNSQTLSFRPTSTRIRRPTSMYRVLLPRACELFRSLACRTYSLKIAILNIDDSSIMAVNHGHAFIQFVLCAFSVACQMAVIFLMPGRVTSNHTRLGIGHFSHLLFSFCLCHCRSRRGHSPLMKSPL